MKYYIILRIPKDRSVINNVVLPQQSSADTKSTSITLYGINKEADLKKWIDKENTEEQLKQVIRQFGHLWDYEIMEAEL